MKPWGVHAMTISFFLALLLADMPSPPTDAATVRAVWLADLDPATVRSDPASGAGAVPARRRAAARDAGAGRPAAGAVRARSRWPGRRPRHLAPATGAQPARRHVRHAATRLT